MDIDTLLSRGVAEILPSKEGLKKLMSERKIKLYQGFDPTGAQLHIGHAVALRKLRQFQDLGHEVIFLVGDGTGQAGDPSGKVSTRENFFTTEELRENARDYVMQAGKIVRFDGENPVKILYNGDWLNKLSLTEILGIAEHFSVQQLLERDMFQERLKEGNSINLREFLYPLLQGFDSVAMDVDLELGGTDQTFNMLAGRTLMKAMKNKEKYVLSVPLLSDASGRKIGKSEGNVIGLTDEPSEFYGKIMALSDGSIVSCFELLTDTSVDEIAEIKKAIEGGSNPIDYKKRLAFELTRQLNSADAAKTAQTEFEKTFQDKAPDFSQVLKISKKMATVMDVICLGLDISNSDAKRLIKQGAIEHNNTQVVDSKATVAEGDTFRLGKKRYITVSFTK
ncbi:tyrosine--tRNA ligase [Candidatus Woesebacteria bacterium RIFCSPHIGHO2_01_FULL_41_10]|uniref:Tyrosine--tRNA ligase n=1 Tax=Candidatus Woesebacteria bacterium RIFCSPHIGHO2_01_FULL_41_10 TaxID=1802500 RepID=A0A1F7YNE9_9BACT|nr:MAG: tyrosine--tRNA ligase [Candidatus Woesebacteria bacterium RIFCSPHIGHO2_01_FULL_41_10]